MMSLKTRCFFTWLVCARLSERLIKQKSFLLYSLKIKTMIGTGARQEMCKAIFVLNSATGYVVLFH